MSKKLKVCLVGSGNFGSAIARILGKNAARHDEFDSTVNMWVFNEKIEDSGKFLVDIINETHVNVKYLPGVVLPDNVRAVADVKEAANGADLLVFCIPHQFCVKACQEISSVISKDAKAISLVKGFHTDKENNFHLISTVVRKELNIDCSCMMGANIANEIASDQFCETTIGSTIKDVGEIFRKLLETENFRVNVIGDVEAVEMCGALKNIVGVAAGFVDGLGLGNNTKASIIRLGLMEMMGFIKHLYPKSNVNTFYESCGVADLITTCYGGRNRQVGEAFVKSNPKKSLEELEKELLKGQKLQGPLTAEEVFGKLEQEKITDKYPLFVSVHKICKGEMEPDRLLAELRRQPKTYGTVP